MAQSGWPPRLGRRSIGSMPIEALRAVSRSKIAIGTSSGPEWLNELKVRITREGSTKMTKPIIICAGIDTGKRKLDVALDGSKEQALPDTVRHLAVRIVVEILTLRPAMSLGIGSPARQ